MAPEACRGPFRALAVPPHRLMPAGALLLQGPPSSALLASGILIMLAFVILAVFFRLLPSPSYVLDNLLGF
jgi:hypothetical protein